MRWITVIVGLALAAVVSAGCKQQCFLTECDYNGIHDRLGLPKELDTHAASIHQPPIDKTVPPPPTILDPDRPARHISLKECIAIALEQGIVDATSANGSNTGVSPNDRLVVFGGTGLGNQGDSVRILALDPAIRGADIDSALSKFDARFLGSMTWSTSDQPLGTAQSVATAGALGTALNAFHQNNAEFRTGIAKPLPTGGLAGITFSTDYQLSNSPAARVNPAYRPTLQFAFEQPLLQGYGVEINQLRAQHPGPGTGSPLQNFSGLFGRPTQEGILVTRLRFDQSRAEFERNIHVMVWNVEQAYWTLYGAYWDLYSREQALRQAFEAWKISKQRFEAGRISIADFAQTRGQYELFRGDRIEALGRVLEAERTLRGFLFLPMEDGCRLVPCDQPTLAPYYPDWCVSLQETLSLRPELVLARQELKRSQMSVIEQKNSLMPDLRFLSSYEITGIGNRLDGPDPTMNALKSMAESDFTTWNLGLVMTMPLGFREAHANVRIARLNLARSYQLLRDQEYRATRFLTQQWRLLQETHALIRARRAQREAFAEQLKARFQEFLAGRGTLDVLLEAQRFWANALSSEYQAIVRYNITLSSWEYAKGTILQHDNVVIGEGPLPGCAQVRAVEHERERTKALVLRERAVPVSHTHSNAVPGLPELPVGEAPSIPALMEKAPPVPREVPEMKLPQQPGTMPPLGEQPPMPVRPTAPTVPGRVDASPATLPSLSSLERSAETDLTATTEEGPARRQTAELWKPARQP